MTEARAAQHWEWNPVHCPSTSIDGHQATCEKLASKGAGDGLPHSQAHGHPRGGRVQFAHIGCGREPEYQVCELCPGSIFDWSWPNGVIIEHVDRSLVAMAVDAVHDEALREPQQVKVHHFGVALLVVDVEIKLGMACLCRGPECDNGNRQDRVVSRANATQVDDKRATVIV